MGADGLNWRDHLKARDFLITSGILVIFFHEFEHEKFLTPTGEEIVTDPYGVPEQEMQTIMARALNIATDNAGFLVSMDSPGFPWVTVCLPTLQIVFFIC